MDEMCLPVVNTHISAGLANDVQRKDEFRKYNLLQICGFFFAFLCLLIYCVTEIIFFTHDRMLNRQL